MFDFVVDVHLPIPAVDIKSGEDGGISQRVYAFMRSWSGA